MKPHLIVAPLAIAIALAALGGARAEPAALAATCRHADVVFYSTDSTPLSQRLHANQSACADYYISTTPANDLMTPRPAPVGPIHANGPQFHVMPEFRLDPWAAWLTSNPGKTWFDAGVEFRRRMAAAGLDVSTGDMWVVNDVGWPTNSTAGAAVFAGTGTARSDLLEVVRGLYTGDTGMAPMPGAIFGAGPVQSTTDLAQYRQSLEAFYSDSGFWQELGRYVRFWAQDTWADARLWGVPGSVRSERVAYLDDYFLHPERAAIAGGDSTAAARAFFATAFTPLGNAAFRYGAPTPPGPNFGYTDIGLPGMQSFVSTQAYALRSGSPDRFGFGVVPNATVAADRLAVEDQIASAIHGSDLDPIGACGPSGEWCDTDVVGAQFNDSWKQFANTVEGSSVSLQLSPAVAVTFTTVDARGATGVTTAPLGGTPPQHLRLPPGSNAYTIETTARFTGPVEVCLPYEAGADDGLVPRLAQLVGGSWVDFGGSVSATTVCGTTSSLGSFAVFAADPTPPVIVPHVAGTNGAGDWYTSDVTVTWGIDEPQGPILDSSGCETTTIATDTAGTPLTCTATSDGGTASVSVTVRRDATPPVLTVPSGVIVDATSPAGATTTYRASAVDALDPAPTVACSPASGSTFTIGTTPVSCIATDAAGNTATGSFAVRVKGSPEQLADLARETIAALAIPSSLRNALLAPLQAAATRFDPTNPNDVRRVLTLLRTFSSIVRVGERTGLIPQAVGEPLLADAARIVRVLGG